MSPPARVIRCLAAIVLAAVAVSDMAAADELRGTPEAATLARDFPFLHKLLTVEQPWESEPATLATALFERRPKLVQGNAAHPLLFQDRRERGEWPGEKVFDQHAYEVEYYAFDRTQPVIKLHLGRPLIFALQHARVEAVARARRMASQFPPLDPAAVPALLARLDALADQLARFGAARLPSRHHLESRYRLPNGVCMVVTNYTGSTNGTAYVEIMLTPPEPVAALADTQTLAFPGAEGFGRFSRGGRGGRVFIVTTLEDYLPDGRPGRRAGSPGQASDYATTLGEGRWIPYVDALGKLHPGQGRPLLPAIAALPAEPVIRGSLREAVEAEGPRTVVFAVSGDIALKSDLVIRHPYLTIAGQSAPGAGVQIRNWGIKVLTHDVILRHLRIRVGEIKGPGNLRRTLGEQTHALDLAGMNLIVDHCEAAYANDQVFNTYGDQHREAVTVQWSYIYGAPTRSTHEKGNHSMGTVGSGWGFVSFHHNLIAHVERRNPRLDTLTYDFRNNVIYNFLSTGYGSDHDTLRLNYVGNTLLRGPDSRRGTAVHAFAESTRFGQWYGADNSLPDGFEDTFGCPDEVRLAAPHPVAPVTTHPAARAVPLVLSDGGATKPVRDEITAYVAGTVRDGTGFVPGTADDWPGGGFATYPAATAAEDDNHNGIPDAWEISRGLDPATCLATGRDLDPHYDNLEVYLNSL